MRHADVIGAIDMRDGSTLNVHAIANRVTGPLLNISIGRPATDTDMSPGLSHAEEIVGRLKAATYGASRAHMGKCMDAWMVFVHAMLSEVKDPAVERTIDSLLEHVSKGTGISPEVLGGDPTAPFARKDSPSVRAERDRRLRRGFA